MHMKRDMRKNIAQVLHVVWRWSFNRLWEYTVLRTEYISLEVVGCHLVYQLYTKVQVTQMKCIFT